MIFRQLYDSITSRLFSLPGEALVYPGHDYNGRWVSSIQQERTINPRLAGKTREQFIQIMRNLDLPKPLIDAARTLQQMGYAKAVSLAGGFLAWYVSGQSVAGISSRVEDHNSQEAPRCSSG